MEYFFALFIEYTIMGRHIESYLILPSKEACQIAIRDNEDMYKYIDADGDVNMWCIDSGVLSQSIRPVLRPNPQSTGKDTL